MLAALNLNLLPVARRELLVMSKRRSTYWIRTTAALATTLMGFSVILPGTLRHSLPAEIGALLFRALAGLAAGFSLASGPLFAADCLSEEERQGTLGLLFLSDLRSHDIVAGKLVSLGLPALYCLVAVFPVLGISFFLGGVSAAEFSRVTLALLTHLIFSLTAAVFVSAFCRSSRRAFGGAVALLLVTCIGPILLEWKPVMGGHLAAASWVALSPLAGSIYALDLTHTANASIYSNSILITLLYSTVWLILACVWLPHSWRDRDSGSEEYRFRKLPEKRLRKRRAQHAAVLAGDPALWLAGRQRSGRAVAWAPALTFAMFAAWFLMHPNLSSHSPGLIMATVLISHGLYKLWVAAEASRGFIADRQSGELELLLATPLDSRQIWCAYLARLKQQFIGPAALLMAGDTILFGFGLGQDAWLDRNPEFILPLIAVGVAFVVDSYTAAWVGLWQSLTSRTATRAGLRTIIFTFLLPGGGFLLMLGTLAVLTSSPEEAMLWLVVGWFVIGCATDIGLCGWTMARLGDSFREAAAQSTAAQIATSTAGHN